jgi:phosphohistidine phosphatase
MKTLFVLRHAKSSWSDPDLSDFDRPLNERGLRAAPMIGDLMKQCSFEPSILVSSPALRARLTAGLVKEAAELEAEVRYDDRIYEASPQGLLQVVSEQDDEDMSMMMVGHNPGIEGFIRFLTSRLEPMPTAALAVIDLNIDRWADIAGGSGELRDIYRPRELAAGK